jgi:hypothetical protein
MKTAAEVLAVEQTALQVAALLMLAAVAALNLLAELHLLALALHCRAAQAAPKAMAAVLVVVVVGTGVVVLAETTIPALLAEAGQLTFTLLL